MNTTTNKTAKHTHRNAKGTFCAAAQCVACNAPAKALWAPNHEVLRTVTADARLLAAQVVETADRLNALAAEQLAADVEVARFAVLALNAVRETRPVDHTKVARRARLAQWGWGFASLATVVGLALGAAACAGLHF